MLRVEGLHAWYGSSHVLQGIDLEVRQGEIVCLIGRNGAGKTTTLKSIMGLIDRRRGRVLFEGRDILEQPAHTRYGLGLAYVPEERRIVPGLSVRDNLRLGLLASPGRSREAELIERTTAIFPRLAERLDQVAVTMSGGEQQMLAIARAMIADPKLIMLDEPAGGINPTLIERIGEMIRELNAQGKTFLIVEHNMPFVLGMCNPVLVLARGQTIASGTADEVQRDPQVLDAYLGEDFRLEEPARA